MTELSYEQALKQNGFFAGPPVGTSMLPLLRQREDVVVIRPCENVRFLDVVLYRRDDGQTVLHRIVGFRDGKYILRGDNQTVNEYGVPRERIIGKLSAFYREGKAHDMQELPLRLYGYVWWALCPLRKAERAIRSALGTLRRRLKS
ncbi:MAG: S24/S26 family peptidase [Oscillospiraceae bacterium]|nr:S24/S26 family peptidase [Oscillospiraceae bacterium]